VIAAAIGGFEAVGSAAAAAGFPTVPQLNAVSQAMFATLRQTAADYSRGRPVAFTAKNNKEVWECVAKWLDAQAAPYFQLRFGLVDLVKVWHMEAKLILPLIQTSIGLTQTRAGQSGYTAPTGESMPTRHEANALHALFVWYMRVRNTLIEQYLRVNEPDAVLRSLYGAELTGRHMLQGNPSFLRAYRR
jgi:hypothetical protein